MMRSGRVDEVRSGFLVGEARVHRVFCPHPRCPTGFVGLERSFRRRHSLDSV